MTRRDRTAALIAALAAVIALPLAGPASAQVSPPGRCDFCAEWEPADREACAEICARQSAFFCIRTCFAAHQPSGETEPTPETLQCWFSHCSEELQSCVDCFQVPDCVAGAAQTSCTAEDADPACRYMRTAEPPSGEVRNDEYACARHHVVDEPPPGEPRPVHATAFAAFPVDDDGEVEDRLGWGVGLGLRGRRGFGVELLFSEIGLESGGDRGLDRRSLDLAVLVPLTSWDRGRVDFMLGPGWTEAEGPAASAFGITGGVWSFHGGVQIEGDLGDRWFVRAGGRARWIESGGQLEGDAVEPEIDLGLGFRLR